MAANLTVLARWCSVRSQIDCWNESASVQSWLEAHPDVALEELYPRHMLKAYQLAAKHNRIGQAWGAPAAPSLAIVASPAVIANRCCAGPSFSAALNFSVNATEPGRGEMPHNAVDHFWGSAEIADTLASGR